jgi:hypothetical protein
MMSNPKHTLFWMFVYLVTVALICVLLYQPLKGAFLANWVFNSLILGVLLVGIMITIRQVLVLIPELYWIRMFRTGETGMSLTREPRLLKPLALHLSGRVKDRFRMSALSLRTVLDGIRARLDESREISRYMIGLLVFLGLLGTFWGLLGTISSVGQIISGLEIGNADFATVFDRLKEDLRQPLEGMGTAFSSSLFGLGGSLVLGFMDIQAGHAQNRFFNGLEEWLSRLTRLIDQPEGDGEDLLDDTEPYPPVDHDLAELVAEMRADREMLKQVLQEISRGKNQ